MKKTVFYGWWIVLATSLIHSWGAGIIYYSFTAFFNPIVAEFGWSYAATSIAASLRSIEGGIASPLVGFAADRYGARGLLIWGSIISGVGFLLFSRIQSLIAFYLVFLFISFGSSLLFPVPGWTVVANWFARKRAMAMGLLSAAIGAGGGLIYFVNWLIGAYGWRYALVIFGIGMWIVGIPSALVIRNRPEPYNLLPDGEVPRVVPEHLGSAAEEGEVVSAGKEFGLRYALKTRAFWFLSLTMMISAAALHAVIVHVMPYLISVGFSRDAASLVASLLVFVSMGGRFGMGWMASRIDTRYLLVLGLILQVVGLVFLSRAQSFSHALLFVISFGPGYGGVITLRLVIQAEYFGRKAFGSIQGMIMAIIVIGTMLSPYLAGAVYDIYGSYDPAWFILAAAILVTIPLALKTHPPETV